MAGGQPALVLAHALLVLQDARVPVRVLHVDHHSPFAVLGGQHGGVEDARERGQQGLGALGAFGEHYALVGLGHQPMTCPAARCITHCCISCCCCCCC
jgi:hypothetical protein